MSLHLIRWMHWCTTDTGCVKIYSRRRQGRGCRNIPERQQKRVSSLSTSSAAPLPPGLWGAPEGALPGCRPKCLLKFLSTPVLPFILCVAINRSLHIEGHIVRLTARTVGYE